jgi:hydroxymethylglutaryl-CoA lyase
MKFSASQLRVFEVGPRDGLQAESAHLAPEARAQFVLNLEAAGLSDIEVGSYVKDDWIPQLAKTSDVLKMIRQTKKRPHKAKFWAFVPNAKGLQRAQEDEIDGASFFVAASDTFCKKNVNRSLVELSAELPNLLKTCKKSKISSRVYLSTLVYCPYEGPTPLKKVTDLISFLIDSGSREIVLSDTTGHATEVSLKKIFDKVLKKHSPKKFAVHFHDTRGLALMNARIALSYGIQTVDSSAGGIGGCPYAPGASGNLATEDLVNWGQQLGGLKSVDLSKIANASLQIEELLKKRLPGRVVNVYREQFEKGNL